ncbi:SGNH/GDSL hydrolase family protein [Xanthobacter sp. KR7-225]|uniref:SGNH/GDSL hydrolase family protein n=1 Tax=Xanthobacter sp. KR7-225 TaxID=3156613 RepID=UPI0032B391CC
MHQPSSVERDAPASSGLQPARLRKLLGSLDRRDLRRIAGRLPWRPLLTVAIAAGAAAMAASHIPPRERLRLQAKLGSYVSTAPMLLVGDSISRQAGPGELCGAPVFNAAVPGDRVADLVADAAAYAARLTAARTVVIAIGANDAWPGHRDLEGWVADYRKLVALYAGRQLVLVEINPPDMGVPMFVKLLDLDFIAGANAAIRTIAAETGARLVPAPARVPTRDGLHPTPAGIELWRSRLVQVTCT